MSNPTDRIAHRPWPIPRIPWAMAMRWHDLAFLHWPVEPEALRPFLPDGLVLDLRDGTAWLGITPFHMSGVRGRLTPSLPRVSEFPEINVRTYVTIGGKPGVWFFSLDAGNALAVRAARWGFGLPYHHASMSVGVRGDGIEYRSVRHRREMGDARFRASYRPTGAPVPASRDTLEYWLTERYCLYAMRGNQLIRAEIHHEPWPLQPAAVQIVENSLTSPLGIDLDGDPPLVHFARELDVVAWLPSVVDD